MADKVEIKFKIAVDDIDEFLIGFLASTPIPINALGVPLYSDEAWPEIFLQETLLARYQLGKVILAQNNPGTQEITIEEA